MPRYAMAHFLISTTHNGGHPARGGAQLNIETTNAHASRLCDYVRQEPEAGFLER